MEEDNFDGIFMGAEKASNCSVTTCRSWKKSCAEGYYRGISSSAESCDPNLYSAAPLHGGFSSGFSADEIGSEV